jgi:hypothetical protein
MNFFIFALQIQCCESGGEHELLAGLQFMMAVARQKIRAASAGDFTFVVLLELIGSLESPPSNLLRATRKPDILVLSEIRG